MRRLLVLIAALAIGFGGAQDYVFGIVFDAGGKFDGSFNEGTWRGLVRGMETLEADEGLEIDLLEFEGTPDTSAQGLRSISEQGADLIVAPGFSQSGSIDAVAQEFPFTYYVNIDGVVEQPNVRSVLFEENEGSFLVGYLAGLMTRTGTVGFVGGMDIPLIRNFDYGYQQGVSAACPDCEVISNYVGTTPTAWNDPARAKELATTQRAQGADIIYAAAGASGNGVIDFVNEQMCFEPSGDVRSTPLQSVAVSDAYAAACGAGSEPLFFIGVDSNQNPRGDTDSDPATLNHGLTSMLKRVDVAAEVAAYDVANDTFTSGIQILGLAEEGVDWALDEYNAALIPQSVIDQINGIRQAVVDGDIVVQPYE